MAKQDKGKGNSGRRHNRRTGAPMSAPAGWGLRQHNRASYASHVKQSGAYPRLPGERRMSTYAVPWRNDGTSRLGGGDSGHVAGGTMFCGR